MSLWEMVAKLAIAAALGGFIGAEREAHERPAGLRTHILVCLGATLFALGSFEIAGNRFDPGRVTAQIVTGIGFLGAGTILHRGSMVRGLTTAASIWSVAAIGIGVAIGGNMLYLAAVASALVVGTLVLVRRLEGALLVRPHVRTLVVTLSGNHEALCNILTLLAEHDMQVRSISTEGAPEDNRQVYRIHVSIGRDADVNGLNIELAAKERVINYNWQE